MNAKKLTKAKKNRPEKSIFFGNPLIQAVEAKMLGHIFRNYLIPKNLAILINYETR